MIKHNNNSKDRYVDLSNEKFSFGGFTMQQERLLNLYAERLKIKPLTNNEKKDFIKKYFEGDKLKSLNEKEQEIYIYQVKKLKENIDNKEK